MYIYILYFIKVISHQIQLQLKKKIHEKSGSYTKTEQSQFKIDEPLQIKLSNINSQKILNQNLKVITQTSHIYNEKNKPHPNYLQSNTALDINLQRDESNIKIENYNLKIKVNKQLKRELFQKIQMYVKTLDQKGEQQLSKILVQNLNKKNQPHSSTVFYQKKIQQMIQVNKLMVKIIKQELLSQKKQIISEEQNQNTNAQQFNAKQSLKQVQKQNIQSKLSNQNKLQLQINEEPSKNEQIQIAEQQKNKQQPEISKIQISDLNYNANHLKNNEIEHVTRQFITEWNKSKIHKKKVYDKFRKSIYQKFAQLSQRQKNQKINDKNQYNKYFEFQPHKQNISLSNSKKQHKSNSLIKQKISTYNKIQQQKLKSYNDKKIKLNIKSHQQNKLIKSQTKPKNQSFSPSTHQKFSKSINPRLNQSFVSKKTSLSKGSSKNIQILSYEDKQQVAKINFENLIEFIFKRAFFYSISKKKVIQNKAQYNQVNYVPSVEEKTSNISFLRYNAQSTQKIYLRTQKLNKNKLNGNGSFLIKSKMDIMRLEKEGNKSFDFLKKCLDDAIQDYLKTNKSK